MIFIDILASILTCISLRYIPKNRKYWGLYALACCLFVIVRLSSGQIGSLFLEIIAFRLAINNLKST